ncbi:MAG: hypothetical protein LBT56_02710 [Prevotellaceae bacterium]|jgi:hypothetical protein|nr:hypothetical protein [Prevotellaceae bacterium]
MDRKKQVEICKSCKNKKISWQQGIICSLTDAVPEFEDSCPEYLIDNEIIEQKIQKKLEKKESEKGEQKLRSLFVFIIVFQVLVSIFAFMIRYPSARLNIIGIALQMVLFHYVLIGKEWAKMLLIILLIIADLFGIIWMIGALRWTLFASFLVIPIVLYSYGIYLLTADKDCIKYFKHKNK